MEIAIDDQGGPIDLLGDQISGDQTYNEILVGGPCMRILTVSLHIT